MSCWETCLPSSTRATSRARDASDRIVRDFDTNGLAPPPPLAVRLCSLLRRYRRQEASGDRFKLAWLNGPEPSAISTRNRQALLARWFTHHTCFANSRSSLNRLEPEDGNLTTRDSLERRSGRLEFEPACPQPVGLLALRPAGLDRDPLAVNHERRVRICVEVVTPGGVALVAQVRRGNDEIVAVAEVGHRGRTEQRGALAGRSQ